MREKLAQLEAGAPPAAPTGEQEGHAPQQEARAPQREQSWGARSLRHALPAVGGAAAAAAPPVAAASGAARKSPRLAAAQSAPKRQCSWGGTSLSQALSAAPAPAPSTAEPSQRSRGGQSGSSGAPKRGGKTRNQQKASARAAAGAQRTAGDAVEEVPPKRQKSGE